MGGCNGDAVRDVGNKSLMQLQACCRGGCMGGCNEASCGVGSRIA